MTTDGTVYGKFALRGVGGISINRASDYFYEISAAAITYSALPFTSGDAFDASVQRYYAGQKVRRAWGAPNADGSAAASIIELDDGTIVIPKLSAPALALAGGSSAVETASYMFHVTNSGGKQQITRTSKTSGVRSIATLTNCNSFAPRASLDGSRIIYLTDRNGSNESYYQLLAGTKFGTSIEHPVTPFKPIAGVGDSIMATGWVDPVASYFGTSLVTPSSVQNSAGGPTAGGGIGSQRAIQIAARYGACGYGGLPALTCSLLNNAMTSGANQLTAISVPLLSRSADAVNPSGDGSGATRTLRASLLGVTGVLTSIQKSAADSTTVPAVAGFNTDNYTYLFTPDAGQTLPSSVPAGSVLTIDPEIRQDSTLIFELGRNDVNAQTGWQDNVKLATAAMYAAYKPLVRRILQYGVTNARTSNAAEDRGSAIYNAIVQLNLDLAALYPDNFFDIRAIYSDGGTTDTPSTTVSDDGLHPNTAGKLIFTNAAEAFITAKGWYA